MEEIVEFLKKWGSLPSSFLGRMNKYSKTMQTAVKMTPKSMASRTDIGMLLSKLCIMRMVIYESNQMDLSLC